MSRSNYNVVYPSQERMFFDGGLNNKYGRALIDDSESPDCLNVWANEGSAETRPGSSILNTASVGSYVNDGLYTRHTNAGAETMVAWFNGTLYGLAGTSFITVGSAQSIYTAGERVGALEYENQMFFGNGHSIPYKYNGTEFTRHGIYPPEGVPSAVCAGTGGISADVQYKVTYVNSFAVEGNPGSATATLAIAAGQVSLTDIPTAAASYGVAARRIYRSDDGATYKRVTEIADNSTTSFVDNVSTLGADAPSDNGVPPKWKFGVVHQDRLFVNDGTEPNLVWYSEVGNPYVFPSTNFRTVGDNTFNLVQALAVYENSVQVLTNRGGTLIYMPDADDANWVNVVTKTQYGSKSPFVPFVYDNKLMYAAFDNDRFVGFATLLGNAIKPDVNLLSVSTVGSTLTSDRIEPDMFLIQSAFAKNMSAIVYDNKAFIAVTYGASQTLNNRIYVFDFSISRIKRQEGTWWPWTGMGASQFTVYNGKLYFAASAATGFVHEMLKSGQYNDNGAAINSYLWTKEISGLKNHVNWFKDFRFAQLLYGKLGDWFMNFLYRTDSDTGAGTSTQIDLNPGGSLWGTMIWGVDKWGGGQEEDDLRIFLGQARGKRIQFGFTNQNTIAQAWKVLGLNGLYNLKGLR